MVKKQTIRDLVKQIDTVHGICPQCEEQAILVAIVTDYYRCTNCGEDTRQYVNGSIKYLRITSEDKKWLKKHKLGSPNSLKAKEGKDRVGTQRNTKNLKK
jgi:hypothetical protein|tara:strand:- start:301 stop:600 length:300 start_codon:yes stop_codon:yes gene_type:complete